MVALTDIYDDPTIRAMHEAMEAKAEQRRGSSVSASMLGNPCERQIWYQMMGYPSPPIQASGLYAIEDGYLCEELIAKRLRMVPGVELETKDAEGNQFGFVRMLGKFKGYIDGFIRGLIQAPATPHIWENKACNETKYKKLNQLIEAFGEKNALKEWDFVYYVQAQIYMGEFGLDRHYMTVCTPGGRAVVGLRTEFDPVFYRAQITKAERIIGAKEPPDRITAMKSHHVCKWCKFAEECWKE